MRVVGITGSGGVGKTTLSVNIASCLAATGVRTLTIDADLYFPDMSSHVRVPSPRSIHDYVTNPEIDTEWLISQYNKIKDLYFVLGEVKMKEIDAHAFSMVSGLIEVLKNYYGAIIVDFPSGVPIESLPLLSSLDLQLIVIDLRKIPLVDLEISILNTVYKYWKDETKKLGVIFNFADLPERRLEVLEEYIYSELGVHILGEVPYTHSLLMEPYLGIPACLDGELPSIERITQELLKYYL